MIELRYSRNNLLNSVLRDAQGTPRFRFESPFKFHDRKTVISRFDAPGSLPGRDDDTGGVYSRKANSDSETDIHMMGLKEEPVAEIHWHTFKEAEFVFDGKKRSLGEWINSKRIIRR